MADLLGRYEASGDLLGACKAAGVTLAELRRVRARDAALDASLHELDLAARAQAAEALHARAAAGDGRALSLLLKRGPELAALATPAPAGRAAARSIGAAATAAYWAEVDRLEALAAGMEPPPAPSVLEGAMICPDCRRPVPPWWAGGGEAAAALARFDELLLDAWNYHDLMRTVPKYAAVLPHPAPPEGDDTP